MPKGNPESYSTMLKAARTQSMKMIVGTQIMTSIMLNTIIVAAAHSRLSYKIIVYFLGEISACNNYN